MRCGCSRTPGTASDWLSLKLTGVKTNRSAIGARITLTVENAGGARRTIHRIVGSGGSFGASPLQQHVGLGRGARIRQVDIWWPASDTRQRFENVGTNQTIAVTEMGKDYTRLAQPQQPLRRETRAAR